MRTFWIIGCVWAVWWVLPRLDAADKELLHAEAIHDDEEWERERRKGWRYPSVADYAVGSQPLKPAVEDADFQTRARRAEALGFMDGAA